jgi:hypothetical protein
LRFVFWGSLRPSADWVWDWVWDWVALGWPKRGPSVAQGRPKRRFKKVLCLQQKLKKGRVGRKSPKIAGIAGIACDRRERSGNRNQQSYLLVGQDEGYSRL